MLEAVEHYDYPLTKEILCGWQTAFFPSGYSEGSQIEVGMYRSNEEHIVSGMFGRERIHYIAPSPDRVEEEMQHFIDWFNSEQPVSTVLRSAIAHLWFVSIHPFEDGNGRLARILSDMMLARGEKSKFRFYNVSSQISKDKNHYYDILERTQHVIYIKSALIIIKKRMVVILLHFICQVQEPHRKQWQYLQAIINLNVYHQ